MKHLLTLLFTLLTTLTMAQTHFYRGAYTNFSDILFSYDGPIPAPLLLILAQ